MRDGTDWHPTRLYQPGLGNGTPVERVQQCVQLGYAKTTDIEKEKLASDLAKLIQVPVPHVEIAPVQGLGLCAISHVHSSRSRPLTSKEDFSERTYSPAERAALKQASGLLPFLAWIAANDHCNDTNLVVDELENNHCRVLAIDFEHAFAWEQGENTIFLPMPPALEANVDPLIVSESLEVIERLTPSQMSGCCGVFEHKPSLRERIERVLKLRQQLLREPLVERGLLA